MGDYINSIAAPLYELMTTEEEKEALDFIVNMASCDCVPVMISSKACHKCGKRGIITQERMMQMVGSFTDEAIMAGYHAILKQMRFRVGDQHDHAMAFRKAVSEYQRGA